MYFTLLWFIYIPVCVLYNFQLNVYQDAKEMTSYLWRELSAATNYAFTVSACNQYTQECGKASNIVTGIKLISEHLDIIYKIVKTYSVKI